MKTSGPIPAQILVLSDYSSLGKEDYEFRKIREALTRAGIASHSCFFATLADSAPPDDDIDNWVSARKTCPGPGWTALKGGGWLAPQLAAGLAQLGPILDEVRPTVVLTLGKGPLAALTGHTEVSKWRGSRLSPPEWPFTIVPVFHPRSLLPEQTFILNADVLRAVRILQGKQTPRVYRFSVRPSFDSVVECLSDLLAKAAAGPLRLSGDLETRAGHIACFGIAWSAEDAICIPHLLVSDDNPFYWTVDEESQIIWLYAQLFAHPNILWVGQNYSYDCQYFYRHWGILPARVRDTMVAHHSLHSNIRKGLDFLSSLYAHDHVYWKDEIKEWDPKIGEEQYWTYNCKDACITFEVDEEIQKDVSERTGPSAQHPEFQQSLFFPVLRMMNRGIRLNTKLRGTYNPLTNEGTGLKGELVQAAIERQKKLEWIVGHELNPKSPKQLLNLFYHDLGIPGIRSLATEALTTNSPALAQIAEREPMLKPLCQLIVELRSIGVFLSTFIDASLDSDGRMRCSFSIAGPTTYRFSSSENAFGSGMNLQNIPVAEKAKIKDPNYIKLPNIRKLFIPDDGYTFFDMDLDRADLQVVVWEAGDNDLKKALRLGLDMHCFSAVDIFDIKGIPHDELSESHPNYKDHRGRIGEARRGKAKAGVHATNYGVGDNKLATALGITRAEAGNFRAKWFAAHPGIRKWHLRVEQAVSTTGYLENKFGARLYNFGRFSLPEFLAWGPQSTVAGVINRALVAIDGAFQLGDCSTQLLIQVHDSLAGQFPTGLLDSEIPRLRKLAEVPIPYDDPLIIPVGFKTSPISWGDCK